MRRPPPSLSACLGGPAAPVDVRRPFEVLSFSSLALDAANVPSSSKLATYTHLFHLISSYL